MTKNELPVPETRVLAIASHVVSGYVGNKIAVFVLQSLGCDVSALNTVQFSNHTGYRQWTGTKTSAAEITSLFDGLKASGLADFDMMLSGYTPGADGVTAVGKIAAELKEKATRERGPGGFFWVLDPVMGDNGSLYVAFDVIPVYRSLVSKADLILPNQFEAELLSSTPITSIDTLKTAIQTLHTRHGIPHIVITSLTLPPHEDHPPSSLCVVGSTMTSDRKARVFKLVFPAIDAYFSGTGDMFAALMVVRMREAVCGVDGRLREEAWEQGQGDGEEGAVLLSQTKSWQSPDGVDALDLPLARAVEMTVGSMHDVLSRTREGMRRELEGKGVGVTNGTSATPTTGGSGENDKATEGEDDKEKKRLEHLRRSKAAELRLVRNLDYLREPDVVFKASRG